MAELLLLLPEYMAALIDHTEEDADGRGCKLLQQSCSFLIADLGDDGGGGVLGPLLSSRRKLSSPEKLGRQVETVTDDLISHRRRSRSRIFWEEPASKRWMQ